MWPAWGYMASAHLCLPGVCVRRALPLLGPVARAAFTNEPITPPSSRTHGRARTPGPADNAGHTQVGGGVAGHAYRLTGWHTYQGCARAKPGGLPDRHLALASAKVNGRD